MDLIIDKCRDILTRTTFDPITSHADPPTSHACSSDVMAAVATGDAAPKAATTSPSITPNRTTNGVDPSRFLGDGLAFKAKLIGMEDVPESRGEKMCHVSMAKLKAVVLAMKEHKTPISVNVSLDGLRIVDEKTLEILHTHPVHRISFIFRDVSDGRAFGYVYHREDGTHQFYAIKTDLRADVLVNSIRDLFEVVYSQKKKSEEEVKTEQATEITADAATTAPDASTNSVSPPEASPEENGGHHRNPPPSDDLLGLGGETGGVAMTGPASTNAWLASAFGGTTTQEVGFTMGGGATPQGTGFIMGSGVTNQGAGFTMGGGVQQQQQQGFYSQTVQHQQHQQHQQLLQQHQQLQQQQGAWPQAQMSSPFSPFGQTIPGPTNPPPQGINAGFQNFPPSAGGFPGPAPPAAGFNLSGPGWPPQAPPQAWNQPPNNQSMFGAAAPSPGIFGSGPPPGAGPSPALNDPIYSTPLKPMSTTAPPSQRPDPFADFGNLTISMGGGGGGVAAGPRKVGKEDFVKEPPKPTLLDLSQGTADPFGVSAAFPPTPTILLRRTSGPFTPVAPYYAPATSCLAPPILIQAPPPPVAQAPPPIAPRKPETYNLQGGSAVAPGFPMRGNSPNHHLHRDSGKDFIGGASTHNSAPPSLLATPTEQQAQPMGVLAPPPAIPKRVSRDDSTLVQRPKAVGQSSVQYNPWGPPPAAEAVPNHAGTKSNPFASVASDDPFA